MDQKIPEGNDNRVTVNQGQSVQGGSDTTATYQYVIYYAHSSNNLDSNDETTRSARIVSDFEIVRTMLSWNRQVNRHWHDCKCYQNENAIILFLLHWSCPTIHQGSLLSSQWN